LVAEEEEVGAEVVDERENLLVGGPDNELREEGAAADVIPSSIDSLVEALRRNENIDLRGEFDVTGTR
jgi:hypothetical protein